MPRSTMMPLARLAALTAISAAISGCQEYVVDRGYYARTDVISYQAGDAVAANKVIHMIDPWPARSEDTNLPYNAKRAAKAIENYEAYPKDGSAATPGTQSLIIAPTGGIK